jgi:hypothetical protein
LVKAENAASFKIRRGCYWETYVSIVRKKQEVLLSEQLASLGIFMLMMLLELLSQSACFTTIIAGQFLGGSKFSSSPLSKTS